MSENPVPLSARLKEASEQLHAWCLEHPTIVGSPAGVQPVDLTTDVSDLADFLEDASADAAALEREQENKNP